jgi:anti-sigma B factor antagonist
MLLEIRQREIAPDISVIELIGKLALGRESQKIETVVDQLIAEGRRKAILDMTKVDYLDSAGLGLLALASGKLKESGGRLAIVVPEGRVLRLLKMTQLNAIVTVAPTLEEAQRAVEGGAQEASA